MFVKIVENLFICDSAPKNDLSTDFFHSFSFVLDLSHDVQEKRKKEEENCSGPLIWNIHPISNTGNQDNEVNTSGLYKYLGSIVLRMRFELTRSNLVLIFIGSCVSMNSNAMTIIVAFFMYKYNIGVLEAIEKIDEHEGLTTNILRWDTMIPSLLLFEKDILLKNKSHSVIRSIF